MTKSKMITNIFDEIETDGQEIVDIWGGIYLPIQWQNLLGQWEAPFEHWGGSMLEFGYEVSQVRHQTNVVPGFLMDSISIAPFALKIHWGYKDAEGEYIAANEPNWDVSDAWRSRVHILALMREAESLVPVIITAGSNTGKHLLANVKQGQSRIQNMLKKINRPNVATHLFWMEMIAGGPVTVGKGETQQTICPPVAVAPGHLHKMTPKAISKHLTDLYVGHDIRDLFNDGLLVEGQEWSVKQPERLTLSDGSDGNGGNGDNVALPAPTTKAAVLDDGMLWLPDLSKAKPSEMIKCGMSVPGLFQHREHASNAFAKILRSQRVAGATDADKWEAWRVELETRWADKMAVEESQNIEAELRGPMPQSDAEISAMDEVEVDADAGIPPVFR